MKCLYVGEWSYHKRKTNSPENSFRFSPPYLSDAPVQSVSKNVYLSAAQVRSVPKNVLLIAPRTGNDRMYRRHENFATLRFTAHLAPATGIWHYQWNNSWVWYSESHHDKEVTRPFPIFSAAHLIVKPILNPEIYQALFIEFFVKISDF